MAVVFGIISGCGLRIELHCRNQPNRSKLALYMLFTFTSAVFKAVVHQTQDGTIDL